jgi:hypothetical protein
MRYAYQRIHKDGLKGNDVVKASKPLYMTKLNQRYIQDAVLTALQTNPVNGASSATRNLKIARRKYFTRQ